MQTLLICPLHHAECKRHIKEVTRVLLCTLVYYARVISSQIWIFYCLQDKTELAEHRNKTTSNLLDPPEARPTWPNTSQLTKVLWFSTFRRWKECFHTHHPGAVAVCEQFSERHFKRPLSPAFRRAQSLLVDLLRKPGVLPLNEWGPSPVAFTRPCAKWPHNAIKWRWFIMVMLALSGLKRGR